MQTTRPGLTAVGLWILILSGGDASAEDWPMWRGAGGQGICQETDLPLRWGRQENVRWKVRLPGPGNSTPIVWDDLVVITQATDGGKVRSTICFDRTRGNRLWQRDVRHEKEEPTHDTNPFTAPLHRRPTASASSSGTARPEPSATRSPASSASAPTSICGASARTGERLRNESLSPE